jgi:hypothetical protein
MYDNEYVYFLAIVEDDTQNDTPNKIVLTGDDPADDANWSIQTNGQDGIGFIFPITETVTGHKGGDFSVGGCYTACHTAKFITTYESGMYPFQGEVDIWYWKAGTTNPQSHADDYVASGASEKRKGDVIGGSFSDENFRDVAAGGNLLPISMPGGDNGGLNKSKHIWDPTSATFDPSANNPGTNQPWKKDDFVSGWKLDVPEQFFPGEGYRGDIEAKGVYMNGKWIVEFKRKINTNSSNDDDVVFDTSKDILFSFAFFNNSRKYAEFEYINLSGNPTPGHFGPTTYVITLKFNP